MSLYVIVQGQEPSETWRWMYSIAHDLIYLIHVKSMQDMPRFTKDTCDPAPNPDDMPVATSVTTLAIKNADERAFLSS